MKRFFLTFIMLFSIAITAFCIEKNPMQSAGDMLNTSIWKKIEIEISAPDITLLQKELEEFTSSSIYELENGKPKIDSSGNAILKGLTGYESDLAEWRKSGFAPVDAVYEEWEESADAVFDEIALTLDVQTKESITVKFIEYKDRIRKELETLLLAEERRFLSYRLKDTSSTKHESNNKLGEINASELLADIVAKSDENIESLQKSVGQDKEIVLKDGLEQWVEYENEFLLARLEWEKTLSEEYLGTEDLWDDVIADFASRRDEWFSQISAIMLEGEDALNARYDTFYADMQNELANVQLALNEDFNSFSNRLDSLFNQFLSVSQSKETAETCISQIQDIRTRLEILRDSLKQDISERLAEIEYQKKMNIKGWEVSEEIHTESDEGEHTVTRHYTLEKELGEWEENLTEYKEDIRKAEAKIAFNNTKIAEINGSGGERKGEYQWGRDDDDRFVRLWIYFDQEYVKDNYLQNNMIASRQNEIDLIEEYIGPFLDILNDLRNQVSKLNDRVAEYNKLIAEYDNQEKIWKDIVKYYEDREEIIQNNFASVGDEIRGKGWSDTQGLQLIKLEDAKNDAEFEVEIAKLVLQYAVDFSSGRETATQMDEAYKASEKVLNQAELNYRESVDKLKGFISAMDDVTKDGGLMDIAHSSLITAQVELSEAQSAYNLALTEYLKNNDENLKDVMMPLQSRIDKCKEAELAAIDEFNRAVSIYEQKQADYKIAKAESELLYSDYQSAVREMRVRERLKEYALSPYSTEEDAKKVLAQAEQIASNALIAYKDACSLNQQSLEERIGSEVISSLNEKIDILQTKFWVEKINEEANALIESESAKKLSAEKSVRETIYNIFNDDFYEKYKDEVDQFVRTTSPQGKMNADSLSWFDFWDEQKESIREICTKANNDKLFMYALAYYYQSSEGNGAKGGYKNIDVAIFSDQNFIKLKDYDYAFYDTNRAGADAVELDTKDVARIAFEACKDEADYQLFRCALNAGGNVFAASYIGKDVSYVAYKLMYDRATERASHWDDKWFYGDRAEAVEAMRDSMTNINGDKERKSIKNKMTIIKDNVATLSACEERITAVEGNGVTYSWEEFISICSQMFSKVNLNDTASLKLCFDALSENDRTGFSNLLENLSMIVDVKYESIEIEASVEEDAHTFMLNQLTKLDDYGSEEIILLKLEAEKKELNKLYEAMSGVYVEQLEYELGRTEIALKNEAAGWAGAMKQLFEEAEAEWAEAEAKMISKRTDWEDAYAEEAEEKLALWEDKYNLIIQSRDEWIAESSRRYAEDQSAYISRLIGLDVQVRTAEIDDILLALPESPPLKSLVDECIDGEKLVSLVQMASGFTERIKAGKEEIRVASLLPEAGRFTDFSYDLKDAEMFEEVQHRIAYLNALNTVTQIGEFEELVYSNIDKANEVADANIEDALEGKGYQRSGNLYSRKILIDKTLLDGIEYERQNIEGYHYFIAPAIDLGLSLDTELLDKMDTDVLIFVQERAIAAVRQYCNVVFGTDDSPGTSESSIDVSLVERLEKAEAAFSKSAQYNEYKGKISGLFYLHIGYVPVMDDEDQEKVKKKGYGEYGRIYELFYINEGRLSRGLTSLDVPFYMQRLWDDDADNDGESDSWLFKMNNLSLRDGGKLVCDIVGAVNPVFGMIFTACDSMTFAALDMNFTGKSFGEAASDVGMRMAMSAVNWAAKGAGKIGNGAINSMNTGSRIATTTAKAVATQYVTNIAKSAIDATFTDQDYSSAYQDTASFNNNWSSYASAGISAGASSGVSSGFTGYLGTDKNITDTFSGLVGGLSSNVFELAVDDETTFNIVNLSAFTKERIHAGLVEMHIGGNDGLSLNFGTDGTDISMGTLNAASHIGMLIDENKKISSASDFAKNNRVALRALYSAGKGNEIEATDIRNLYNALISKNKDITFTGSCSLADYSGAETVGSNIFLNSKQSSDITNQLAIAVILAHESARDGVLGSPINQEMETVKAVLNHSYMASLIQQSGYRLGNNTQIDNEADMYRKGDIAGLTALALLSYDSSGDYWRIMSDGSLKWDGQLNFYMDGETDIEQMDSEMGKVLDYWDIVAKLQEAIADGKGTVTIGGVEIPISEARKASQINDRILISGRNLITGRYKSDTATALFQDGYMSMDEALMAQDKLLERYDGIGHRLLSFLFPPSQIEMYSVQYVLGEHDKVNQYFADEKVRDVWTNENDKNVVNAGGKVEREWNGKSYKLYSSYEDLYHVNPEDANTFKWSTVSETGPEFVFGKKQNGSTYLDNSPERMGTSNFITPDEKWYKYDSIGHLSTDMLGYYHWGNTPTDTTGLIERLFALKKRIFAH